MKPAFRVPLVAGIAALVWGGLSADANARLRVTGLPRDLTAVGGTVTFRFVVGPAHQVQARNPKVKLRVAGSGGSGRLSLERETSTGRRYAVRVRKIRRDFTAVITVKEPGTRRTPLRERIRVHAG